MSDKDGIISIGVGAVVFRGDDVLLIKRGKPPFLGAWSIPGGRPEFGEALEAATLREIREETAIEARISGFLGVYEFLPKMTPDQGYLGHVVIVDYIGEWVAGEPCAGDDAAAAGFFPLEAALTMTSWDETRAAIARAAELRRAAR
jgi:8-oxo-dGTP diphosphatase